jgi:hypothetical protein
MSEMRAKYVEIIKKSVTLQEILLSWKETYMEISGEWKTDRWEKIYNKLSLLSPDANAETISNTIGNKSWTHLTCESCQDYISVAIGIGEYDKKFYCPTCISEAYEIMLKNPDDAIPF